MTEYAPMPAARVALVVRCSDDHLVGVWLDAVNEKYPFWCPGCEDVNGDGDLRRDKYPWRLAARVVSGGQVAADGLADIPPGHQLPDRIAALLVDPPG